MSIPRFAFPKNMHAEIALPAGGEKSLEVSNEQKMC